MDDPRPAPDEPASPPARVDPAELASDPRRLAAALATVLDQQSRDAAANRAQARDLIRAVDGLAKSHEFLGLELREERRRSRVVLVAALLAPLAGAAVAILALTRTDEDPRIAGIERGLAEVRSRNDEARVAALRSDYERRMAAAGEDAAALRTDLEATRKSLSGERTAREAHEREVAARLTAAERDRSELVGVRAELSSLREIAGAEKARADDLARLLAEAARRPAPEPAAPAKVAADVPAGAPGAPSAPSALPAPPAPTAATSAPPAPRAPDPPAAAPPPAAPAPAAPSQSAPAPSAPAAARDPADLDRVVTRLNGLLDGTTGAARYRIEGLEGVSGTDLLGVRIVGRDVSGRTLRTVEAKRAQITVSPQGGVRLRFDDGHLVVAGRKAPFFDGSYTLALDGSADAWRASGLTCLRFE